MNFVAPEAVYSHCPVLPPSLQNRYYRALLCEMTLFVERSDRQKTVRSIFLAGDFSSPSAPLLDTLGILRVITLASAEISLAVTCPPSEQDIRAWQGVGINRINCSIRDSMKHTWLSYVRKGLSCARMSIDLWLDDEWRHDEVQLLLDAGVQHITVALEQEATAAYHAIAQQLGAAGFEHYSAHDFALPGHRSVQQELYFACRPYQGFGLGACSFDGRRRTVTTDAALVYCEALESATPETAYQHEELTHEQRVFEIGMQGLMSTGLAMDELMREKSETEQQRCMQEIDGMVRAGLVKQESGWLSLTMQGHLVENEVITKLLLD